MFCAKLAPISGGLCNFLVLKWNHKKHKRRITTQELPLTIYYYARAPIDGAGAHSWCRSMHARCHNKVKWMREGGDNAAHQDRVREREGHTACSTILFPVSLTQHTALHRRTAHPAKAEGRLLHPQRVNLDSPHAGEAHAGARVGLNN